jgi:hypothetical protein
MFGVAIGTVILPHLSTTARRDPTPTGLQPGAGLGPPAVACCSACRRHVPGCSCCAEPLMATLVYQGMQFHRPRFAHGRQQRGSLIAQWPPRYRRSCSVKVLAPAFYSRGRTRKHAGAGRDRGGADQCAAARSACSTIAVACHADRAGGAARPRAGIGGRRWPASRWPPMRWPALANAVLQVGVNCAATCLAVAWRRRLSAPARLGCVHWRDWLAACAGCWPPSCCCSGMRGRIGATGRAIHGFWLRLSWLLAAIAAGAVAYGAGLLLTGLRPRHLRF